jgi:hypothetical protein
MTYELGTRVYVIAKDAPRCRVGVVQKVHERPTNGGPPTLRGYTVLHDEGEPDPDGFVRQVFGLRDKRDWNWTPAEVVTFAVFDEMVRACHGDASMALEGLRVYAAGRDS